MRILLVNPPRFEGIPVIREERCEITERYSILEPYSLLQMGSLLRAKGHQVELIDLNGFDLAWKELEARVRGSKPEAALFRFTPTTFDHDMRTAAIVKAEAPGAKTIGVCWTLRTLARQVMSQAHDLDFYVRQEYEVVAPDLIEALREGRSMDSVPGIAHRRGQEIMISPDALPLDDYDSLPIPSFDLLPSLDPYFVTAPAGRPYTILYTSKGCPFKCSFCTVAGTKWRPKSAEKTMEELRFLKKNYGIRTVSFFDETFTLDKKRVLRICEALVAEDLDIRWYCNTRAHLVDLDLLKKMRRAGCRGISYGIESGSQSILDHADKCVTVEQARNALAWARQARIKTFASFILGLPGETWQTVGETIDFVGQTIPTSAEFNVAVPYPGTKLYEMVYGEKGGEAVDFRRLYQDDAVVGTEALTPADLNKARDMAYRSLYFNPRWWLRNIGHVLKEPEDMDLATRYATKALRNYLVHRMKHAH
ncbi:MAG TPA: radical SAM protein [Methanomassiliicoccales archaeon]|nr:radical SAM protein [Methanomassiliicoccales archaeon]